MSLYDFLTKTFDQFVSIFPGPLQWLVTLLVLVGLVVVLVQLIQHNFLFIIVAVLLLPFLLPIVGSIFRDLYDFIMYLAGLLNFANVHINR